jgi:hypothetical protein
MTDQQPRQSFWTTVPGILTGIAAVITAVTGLLVGLSRNDAPRSEPSEPRSAATAGVTATREPKVEPTPTTAEARSLSNPSNAERQVTITPRNGQVTKVFGGSFQHNQTARELYLQSGQRIPFDRIETIEFTRQEPDRALVRITLVDGVVHEDAVSAGLSPFGFQGTNDLGRFDISVSDLAQITFER